LGGLSDVAAVAAAHASFCERVWSRCFLDEQNYAAELSAIDAILSLALRLRVQLEALATLPAAAHAAAARRY